MPIFLTEQQTEFEVVKLPRFAKWKRDAEYWYERDSAMFENLFNSVNEKLVCLLSLSRSFTYVSSDKGYRSPQPCWDFDQGRREIWAVPA